VQSQLDEAQEAASRLQSELDRVRAQAERAEAEAEAARAQSARDRDEMQDAQAKQVKEEAAAAAAAAAAAGAVGATPAGCEPRSLPTMEKDPSNAGTGGSVVLRQQSQPAPSPHTAPGVPRPALNQ
jgi:DNA repair exonuclease SbcCD ATPase subunit